MTTERIYALVLPKMSSGMKPRAVRELAPSLRPGRRARRRGGGGMIHARNGSGYAGYRIALAIGLIAIIVVLASVAAGVGALELEVPWKGIAVLVCAALAAAWTRLRDR